MKSGLDEPSEALVEPGQAAATINQVLLPASPRRMRARIDIKRQFGARLTPRRARTIARAIVQNHVDEVIVGMNALFHVTPLVQ